MSSSRKKRMSFFSFKCYLILSLILVVFFSQRRILLKMKCFFNLALYSSSLWSILCYLDFVYVGAPYFPCGIPRDKLWTPKYLWEDQNLRPSVVYLLSSDNFQRELSGGVKI